MALPDFELPLTPGSGGALGGQNGRVNFTSRTSAGGSAPSDFAGYGYQKTSEKNFETDMLRGNWETTPVSTQFFSAANLKIIQHAIRRKVFEMSQPKGYIIDDQSVDELKMIMRALFLQYSRNVVFNVQEQINELNGRVVEWSAPHVLSAVDQYFYYIEDISHLPVPLTQSVNMSRAGTKSLPLAPFM